LERKPPRRAPGSEFGATLLQFLPSLRLAALLLLVRALRSALLHLCGLAALLLALDGCLDLVIKFVLHLLGGADLGGDEVRLLTKGGDVGHKCHHVAEATIDPSLPVTVG
jgi:hypothetical protein